jgi:hypothetical protein
MQEEHNGNINGNNPNQQQQQGMRKPKQPQEQQSQRMMEKVAVTGPPRDESSSFQVATVPLMRLTK